MGLRLPLLEVIMYAMLLSRIKMVQEERTRSPCKICRAVHISYVESNSTRSPAFLEQTEERERL